MGVSDRQASLGCDTWQAHRNRSKDAKDSAPVQVIDMHSGQKPGNATEGTITITTMVKLIMKTTALSQEVSKKHNSRIFSTTI